MGWGRRCAPGGAWAGTHVWTGRLRACVAAAQPPAGLLRLRRPAAAVTPTWMCWAGPPSRCACTTLCTRWTRPSRCAAHAALCSLGSTPLLSPLPAVATPAFTPRRTAGPAAPAGVVHPVAAGSATEAGAAGGRCGCARCLTGSLCSCRRVSGALALALNLRSLLGRTVFGLLFAMAAPFSKSTLVALGSDGASAVTKQKTT